ncbi:MAG: 23S rRNA (uracil(1939)-C(5))-methyltransferase RlmD [Oscillospiraceae bacterium]|nr:23S rRNA (uracil(1939)-C(5))-methyltransferase RlmD [Oscillospiraceae bacterium]
MTKNDILQLDITGMTLQGTGIARADGLAVFVPGTCPGDSVEAVVTKVKENCAYAKCRALLRPSPERIDPGCPVFPRCGGCAFRHLSYEAELAHKQRELSETLRRVGKLAPPMRPIVPSEKQDRYRNKALLPVRMEEGRVHAGFFARHSHRMVHCGDCLLQPEVFGDIARAVCAWAEENGCGVYDDATGKGLLRHIYLRQTQNGARIMACLVINGQNIPRADRLISALRAQSTAIKGIALNHNSAATNVALGRQTSVIWGTERITEILCGMRFSLSPLSFFQVNPAQAERLYTIAGEYAALTGTERVLDLYCGTGTIGLTMAVQARELVGVETVPQAVEDAERNAAENGIANARFLRMDAAEAAARLASEGWRPDVIVVDPPRKGCDEALLRTMARMKPGRIVYISCDPATLARDLALLEGLGYTVRELRPVDMFPRAGHVEAICWLSKQE